MQLTGPLVLVGAGLVVGGAMRSPFVIPPAFISLMLK